MRLSCPAANFLICWFLRVVVMVVVCRDHGGGGSGVTVVKWWLQHLEKLTLLDFSTFLCTCGGAGAAAAAFVLMS